MGSEWLVYLGQMCVGWDRRKLSSLGVHATVFQKEIFAVLACAKHYTGEHTYMCTDNQSAWQALEASGMTELVWEFSTLSSRNKVMHLWVPGHSGIQGNEDADTSTKRNLVICLLISNQQFPSHHVLAGSRTRTGQPSCTLNAGWPLQVWDSQGS
jgi:hypothetical protein